MYAQEIKELLDERDKLIDSFFTLVRDCKFIDVEANLKQQKVIEAKLMILLDSVVQRTLTLKPNQNWRE